MYTYEDTIVEYACASESLRITVYTSYTYIIVNSLQLRTEVYARSHVLYYAYYIYAILCTSERRRATYINRNRLIIFMRNVDDDARPSCVCGVFFLYFFFSLSLPTARVAHSRRRVETWKKRKKIERRKNADDRCSSA